MTKICFFSSKEAHSLIHYYRNKITLHNAQWSMWWVGGSVFLETLEEKVRLSLPLLISHITASWKKSSSWLQIMKTNKGMVWEQRGSNGFLKGKNKKTKGVLYWALWVLPFATMGASTTSHVLFMIKGRCWWAEAVFRIVFLVIWCSILVGVVLRSGVRASSTSEAARRERCLH